jgi:putative transposase
LIRLLRVLNGPESGVQKRRHLHDLHGLADFTPMPNAVQSLLILLAHATDRELARQVQYLKNENRVLRARLPEKINTTPAERSRLLKYGRPVGAAINQLITIVVPSTFHRWVRESKGQKRKSSKIGRPKKPIDLKKLILKIARDTGWGTLGC